MRRLLSAAATASLLLAQAPVLAEGKADDLGVMSVKLTDVVKSNFGIQAETQGAGTPNEVGVGGFIPLSTGDNNVFYADMEANANLADFSGYSSIVGTEVDGITVSTSSRLGYRWLNSDRSWMFGFNAGYDSRPMNTGDAEPFHPIKRRYQHLFHPSIQYATNPRDVFFQQVAAGLEAVSSTWNFNAYALVPIGETEQRLNSHYNGGALDTYGLDVGYFITPDINALVGYYYQQGDLGDGDSSGVKARLAFSVAQGVEFGGNYSYDDAFAARASADITIRLGWTSKKDSPSKEEKIINEAQIVGLSLSPQHRNVRVHDMVEGAEAGLVGFSSGMTQYFISGHPDCKVHLTPQCETKVIEPNGDWHWEVTGGTAARGLKPGQRVKATLIHENWMEKYFKDDL